MDVLAQVTEFVGVPAWGLLPVALVAAVVLFVVFDALSHVVLKPFKSQPVIGTWPVIGGMIKFLKGPIGLMNNAFPKYGEVFTGASRLEKTPGASARAIFVDRAPNTTLEMFHRTPPSAVKIDR